MTQPGWYPNPQNPTGPFRWWDGTGWTDRYQDSHGPDLAAGPADPQGGHRTTATTATTSNGGNRRAGSGEGWAGTVPGQQRPVGATPMHGTPTLSREQLAALSSPHTSEQSPQPAPEQTDQPEAAAPDTRQADSQLFLPRPSQVGRTLGRIALGLVVAAMVAGAALWYQRAFPEPTPLANLPRLINPASGLSVALPEGWKPTGELDASTPGYDCPAGPARCHSGFLHLQPARNPRPGGDGVREVAVRGADSWGSEIIAAGRNNLGDVTKDLDYPLAINGRHAHLVSFWMENKVAGMPAAYCAALGVQDLDGRYYLLFVSALHDQAGLDRQTVRDVVDSVRFNPPARDLSPGQTGTATGGTG